MNLNADFSKRVVVHGASVPWQSSPMPGVDRRMLDRLGNEVARATSIVRYAPGSVFPAHGHTGGEEFLVLEGVFQDEHGDFPAGSYVRNPPESRHTPRSNEGCIIFVKLWQFDLADRTPVVIGTHAFSFTADSARPNVEVLPLFQDEHEQVTLEHWAAESAVTYDVPNGMEVLVLDGSFTEGDDVFETQSWLRLPKQSAGEFKVGPKGARVWVKRNDLGEDQKAPTL